MEGVVINVTMGWWRVSWLGALQWKDKVNSYFFEGVEAVMLDRFNGSNDQ